MLYSHASELALRAVLYLAQQPPGKLSPVHEVARGTGLSKAYLAKILQRLIQARLVRAFRGRGGGMELGRPPEEISLALVVRAMEGPGEEEQCVLNRQLCQPLNPCPLHSRWAPLRLQMRSLLEESTVASVAKQLKKPRAPRKNKEES